MTVNIVTGSMLKGLGEAGCRITTICKCKGYSATTPKSLKNYLLDAFTDSSERLGSLDLCFHCKKWGVTVHLYHCVLGHLRMWWCNVTLQGVLVCNGVFHNTLKKCIKVI